MKKSLHVLGPLSIMLFGAATFAAGPPIPGLHDPNIASDLPEQVFTPKGFDDNDSTQIVLYGDLMDSCHKAGTVEVMVDHEKKKIFLRNLVYSYPGCWCFFATIPYTQVANVGILGAGQYEVMVEDHAGKYQIKATLPIAVSTSAFPDDYLYAPVSDVVVERFGSLSGATLTLKGTFHSSCMAMQELKVTYRPGNVIEIQPVASFLNSTECHNEARSFETKVELKIPTAVPTLIHVRSLNGQAINKVITF